MMGNVFPRQWEMEQQENIREKDAEQKYQFNRLQSNLYHVLRNSCLGSHNTGYIEI